MDELWKNSLWQQYGAAFIQYDVTKRHRQPNTKDTK